MLALALALFTAATILSLALAATAPQTFRSPGDWLMSGVWLAFAAVGALVASRRPGNAVGWLCGAIGLGNEVTAFALAYVHLEEFGVPGSLPAVEQVAWLINLWVVTWDAVPLLLLLFPDGKLPSSRWRPLVWLMPAHMLLGLLTSGLQVGSVSSFMPVLPGLLGVELGERVHQIGTSVVGWGELAMFGLAAAAIVVRFRRARGVERQQLKWLVYAAACLALAITGTAALFFSPARTVLDPSAAIPPQMFGGVPVALGFAAIPVAVGIAILRYRLYEIDLLINRTLVYTTLTVILALSYWASVVLLQQLLQPLTQGSELAIIGSTLAVAALFQPARGRIQQAVDHRFYRRKYDAQRTLEQFAARLRQEVELDTLSAELLGVVQRTMQPAHTSLWLRPAPRRAEPPRPSPERTAASAP